MITISDKRVLLQDAKFNIASGETRSFEITVDPKVTLLDLYLEWGNPKFSLILTTHPPDGKGESYTDSYNRTIDGKIAARVRPKPGPYITQGTWTFTVHAQKVTGVIDYTFKIYAHVPI